MFILLGTIKSVGHFHRVKSRDMIRLFCNYPTLFSRKKKDRYTNRQVHVSIPLSLANLRGSIHNLITILSTCLIEQVTIIANTKLTNLETRDPDNQ